MNATFESEINTEGLPAWLREIVNRAWTTSGFGYKKSASEQAIASLQEVDLATIEDKDCPICYDAYELPKSQQGSVPEDTSKSQRYTKDKFAEVVRTNNEIISNVYRGAGETGQTGTVEPLARTLQFNDPALFLPTDEGAEFHQRVPMRNLSTLQTISMDESFPGYKDDAEQKQQEQEAKQKKMQEEGHIAVKMPNCNHIFGKSCIIEWLKNNVSCPLCREEVEASASTTPNPVQRRLNDLRSNLFHNFNEVETMTSHLVSHSTDVFCPFARPFNPAIAPLTESYMTASWASPSSDIPAPGVPDPTIVVPRRFPFPSITHTSGRPRTPMRRNLMRRSPTNLGTYVSSSVPAASPATAAAASFDGEAHVDGADLDPGTGSTRVHFSPHTTTIGDLEDSSNSDESEDRDPEEEAPLLPSPSLNHNPLFEGSNMDSPALSPSMLAPGNIDGRVPSGARPVSSMVGGNGLVAPIATITSVTGGIIGNAGRSGGPERFRRAQSNTRSHPYVRIASPNNPGTSPNANPNANSPNNQE